MPYLVALTGPYSGDTFEIKDGKTAIGRGSGCDLVLERDPTISRTHALLVCAGGVVQVQDAGSTHGVYVNGQPAAQSILHIGDCLQLGESAFVLEAVPAQIHQPRLKMVTPAGMPGAPAAESSVNPAVGCLLIAVVLLMPIPFGFMIARLYMGKKGAANERFGIACIILSVISTVVQFALAFFIIRPLYEKFRPFYNDMMNGDAGLLLPYLFMR